jgi:nanoRNase/pAp phosphatase (c-di-AMP/oligoRNAs hydrolase)
VFTPVETRRLQKLYPGVYFKTDRSTYQEELQDIVKRNTTIKKVSLLKSTLNQARRIIAVICGNPDPDAIASAYGLKTLLKKDFGSYLITYTGELTRPENKTMVETMSIQVSKFDNKFLDENCATVALDAQPSFYEEQIKNFDAIIDHHPKESSHTQAEYIDIRPDYGSTSTILTEYFRDLGEKIPKKVATALFYGLKTDTNNLQRNVSQADIDAFVYLRNIIDENILRRIELSQFPKRTLDYFGIALVKKKVAQDVIFAYLGHIDDPDASIYVADLYLRVEGVAWAIVASIIQKKLIVIFRCDGFRKNAGKTIEVLFGEFGRAGGHRTMARAEINLENLSFQTHDDTDKNVEEWLLKRLSQKFKQFKKTIAQTF